MSDLLGMSRWTVIQGDCRDILPTLEASSVHCVITDPPYSAKVHKAVRSGKRNEMRDGAGRHTPCTTRRVVDLGFEHLDPDTRRLCAREFARLATRWVLAFSDIESCWLWRISLEAAGLKYHRTGAWDRIGGAPQFTGTEPANAVETITMTHQPGKHHWNGGGHRAFYSHPIVANRKGEEGTRLNEAQKPEGLMIDLVEEFSDPDDIVLDPFCGSGTTGVACLKLGRRFIGFDLREAMAETARARLAQVTAELPGARAKRARQCDLF